MNFRGLESLVRIRQISSFSQSAALQNMTLPALSMQMKTLESELGVAIFDRSYRPPRLTPLGRQIADQAAELLRERNALTSLTEADDPLVGNFQIGFIQSASVRILPTLLTNLDGDAPLARINATSGLSEHLSNLVEDGQLDAAIVTKVHDSSSDLNVDLITADDMVIAVPDQYKQMDNNELSRALPFLHFMPSTGIGRLIASSMQYLSAPAEQTIILDSIEATVECVKKGLGFTILPCPDVQRYADAHVHVRNTDARFPQRELVLVSKPSAHTKRWRQRLLALILLANGST